LFRYKRLLPERSRQRQSENGHALGYSFKTVLQLYFHSIKYLFHLL